MNLRRTAGTVAAALIATGGLALSAAPSASSQPSCPDIEVSFARGTGEPAGVGGVGQAFVDAVRAQANGRTVGVYAVNYPASNDFGARTEFARTVVDGVRDEADHVTAMARDCPNTKQVLGGFSQGAAVTGFVTSSEVPAGVPAELVPAPLPPNVADKVAAVVLFGTPSPEFLQPFGAPSIAIGSLFTGKTLELCADGDTICNGAPAGGPTFAHASYPFNGQVSEGAAYAVART